MSRCDPNLPSCQSGSSSSTSMTFDAVSFLRGRTAGAATLLCDSPSGGRSRKLRREASAALAPISHSSSVLPNRKRIKTCSHGSPPPFRAEYDGRSLDRAEECGGGWGGACDSGGYDASANLSVSAEESETSMSFGSAHDDNINENGDEEEIEDDEMDDESSCSELSFDFAAFEFGYHSKRSHTARTGVSLTPCSSHRTPAIVVEVPDHVRRELDQRAAESEHGHARAGEPRVPEALQEIFLRSQRGETVDHPPPSGAAFRVFPSWPAAAVAEAAESTAHPSNGPSAPPTKPRRRGSMSEASTIKDDDGAEDVKAQGADAVPLVLDRWRPLARSYGHPPPARACPQQQPHRRIQPELQNAAAKSQKERHDRDHPPIRGIGAFTMPGRDGGAIAAAAATSNRWGAAHSHCYYYYNRQPPNEAPTASRQE